MALGFFLCVLCPHVHNTWTRKILGVSVFFVSLFITLFPSVLCCFPAWFSFFLEIFPSIGLVLSWHRSSHRFLHYVWYPVVEWKFWKGGWMHIPKITEWGSSVNIIGSLQALPLRCSHSLGHHHDSVFFSRVHFICQLLISEWALISCRGFRVLLGQAEHTIIFNQPFFFSLCHYSQFMLLIMVCTIANIFTSIQICTRLFYEKLVETSILFEGRRSSIQKTNVYDVTRI